MKMLKKSWLFFILFSIKLFNLVLSENHLDILNNCLTKKHQLLLSSSKESLSLHNLPNNIKKYNSTRLDINKPIIVTVRRNQPRRFDFTLNESSPLGIKFLANFSNFQHLLYYNNTVINNDIKDIFFPCAMKGKYDLLLWIRVKPKKKNRIKIEIFNQHPHSNWQLLNRSTEIKLRTQNRLQKKQMILKWSKSQLDVHAIHYCLVINTKSPKKNFCHSVDESMRRTTTFNCNINNHWIRHRERVKRIDSNGTNVICTGKKSQQIINGLIPNNKYFIDIFGLHTTLKNLPIYLKSTSVWFNRTHPTILKDNEFSIQRLSGMTSISVFSFKVPSNSTIKKLRYFILPCGGSQIDVKILRQKIVLSENSIYRPTYIDLDKIVPGGRYLTRIYPSNDDEISKANKVGIAISTTNYFNNLPELPQNTSVFEMRSLRTCNHTTIAWYASPEKEDFRYCVIIMKTPFGAIDQTNYCIDFSKKILKHQNFQFIVCKEKSSKQIEDMQLLNLYPRSSYLIYVTINLLRGNVRPLPYQSLKINFNFNNHCHRDSDDLSSLIDF